VNHITYHDHDAENNTMGPNLDVNAGCDHTHTHTHSHTTLEDQESEKNIIDNMTKLITVEDQDSEKNIM
jgi:hypothetical protein